MAKSKYKRVAAVLLVLTLVTSAFVGGAYAKYITEANGADTARVAKFGVQVKAGQDLYAEKYAKDDKQFSYAGEYSVEAFNNTDELVAPGTKGSMELFNISGKPEVAVNVKASLNENTALKMVTLPTGTYTDYTACNANGTYSDIFKNAGDYYPVVWTLKHDGQQVVTGNLKAIDDYLTGDTFSKNYDPNTGLDAINGSWTLDWAWDYGTGATDAQDTYLGNIAAGIKTDDTVNLIEAFNFNITVTQID